MKKRKSHIHRHKKERTNRHTTRDIQFSFHYIAIFCSVFLFNEYVLHNCSRLSISVKYFTPNRKENMQSQANATALPWYTPCELIISHSITRLTPTPLPPIIAIYSPPNKFTTKNNDSFPNYTTRNWQANQNCHSFPFKLGRKSRTWSEYQYSQRISDRININTPIQDPLHHLHWTNQKLKQHHTNDNNKQNPVAKINCLIKESQRSTITTKTQTRSNSHDHSTQINNTNTRINKKGTAEMIYLKKSLCGTQRSWDEKQPLKPTTTLKPCFVLFVLTLLTAHTPNTAIPTEDGFYLLYANIFVRGLGSWWVGAYFTNSICKFNKYIIE